MASTRLRIVEISTDRLPCPPRKGGAIETYVYGLSNALSKWAEVHVITFDEKECTYIQDGVVYHTFTLETPKSKILAGLCCHVSELNKNLIYVTAKIIDILRRIEKEYGKIDCIHAHHFNTCLAPIFYRSIYGKVRLFLHYHNEFKSSKLNKWVANEYDTLLAVSQFIKTSVMEKLQVDSKKVKIVHNAIDPEIFRFNAVARQDMRTFFNLSDNELILLYVGRITFTKGLHLLVQSLPSIRKIVKVKLLIIGPKGGFDTEDTTYFSAINKLVAKLDLQKSVFYLGNVEKERLIKLYSACDIVVVPSIWPDPCPSVVMEAMACERIVVAHSVGGIPEIFHETKTGYLVEPVFNSETLSETILEAVKSKNRSSIQLDSREVISKSFSLNSSAQRIIDLLTK